MERIYINRQDGQRRIHIEMDEAEVADLLDDLTPPESDSFAATHRLIGILEAAHADFHEARRDDAHQAETSRT